MNAAVSPQARRLLWAGYWLLLIFLYAPVAVLVVFSFNAREIVSFPWEGFTLRWYAEFLGNRTLRAAVGTSTQIALLAAVCTVVLATLTSLVTVRRRFRGEGLVSAAVLAPLIMPLVVLAIALQVLFHTVGIPASRYTVIVGHVVIALPFAVLTLVPRLRRIGVSLEEAARDLGATQWRAFRDVTFPLMVPALVSAFLIAFTISFDEIVVASFVAGEDTTLPLYLFSQLRTPRQLPQIVAVAVVVMVLSGVTVCVAEVLRRASERRLVAARRSAPGPVEEVR